MILTHTSKVIADTNIEIIIEFKMCWNNSKLFALYTHIEIIEITITTANIIVLRIKFLDTCL